jgi:hypothetical protein
MAKKNNSIKILEEILMKLIKTVLLSVAFAVGMLASSANVSAREGWTVRAFVVDGIRYILCCNSTGCYIQDSYPA